MNKTQKQHYRNVFKSDHLSTFDLEDFIEQGRVLEFTIKHVSQSQNAKVAGKVIPANIAHFEEPIKPLVLNASNSKVMAKLTGSSFVDDWRNVEVELYILTGIKFGKNIVDGVRIKDLPVKPITENDIKVIIGRLATITSQAGLSKYFSRLTSKEKVHSRIVDLLKEKQLEIKQDS